MKQIDTRNEQQMKVTKGRLILKLLYLRRRCKIPLWKSLTLRFDIVLHLAKPYFKTLQILVILIWYRWFYALSTIQNIEILRDMLDTKPTIPPYAMKVTENTFTRGFHTSHATGLQLFVSQFTKQRVGCTLSQLCNNDDVLMNFPFVWKLGIMLAHRKNVN